VFLTSQPGLLGPAFAGTRAAKAASVSVDASRAMLPSALVVTTHSHKGFHML
jgi:hypothetical protein